MPGGKVLAGIGVRSVALLFAGAGVCAALLLGPASGQAAGVGGSYTCTGPADFSEFSRNLTVPAGARCGLVGDAVEGNVSVGDGARFTAIGTVIEGSVSTDGAEEVSLINTEVDGNASFRATSGPTTFFCLGGAIGDSVCLGPANRFFGNVSVTKTSPAKAVLTGNSIAQDLSCTGNESVTNLGLTNTVLGEEFGECEGL
jgi:hypothetical protein